jgi:hypothetical protein
MIGIIPWTTNALLFPQALEAEGARSAKAAPAIASWEMDIFCCFENLNGIELKW